MTDAEIVTRVRAGDNEAYGELVIRYQNAVYGQAYHKLQNFEDARDVAQEALVQAYLRLGQLRDPEKFGSWLRQITINECHMWQRRQRAMEPLDDMAATTREAEQIENQVMISEALLCLSESSRLTLTLFYIHSYSLQEIAAFLEVPVTTIKSRLRNARARLRKELMEMVEDKLKQKSLPDDFAGEIRESIVAAKNGDWSRLERLMSSAKDNPALEEALRLAMKELKGHWQRFTAPSRCVCLFAGEEAKRQGSSLVEPEHLLLGLLRENKSIGSQVLRQTGISLPQLQQTVADMAQPHDGADDNPRMSPKAERVLVLAAEEAKTMAELQNISADIGTEHMLLGLMQEPNGVVAEILEQSGLDRAKALSGINAIRQPL